METTRNTRSPLIQLTLFGKQLQLISQITTRKDKREPLLSYLVGHMLISNKSAPSLGKLVTWVLRSSHHKSLFGQMSGHKMESLTHGSLCTSQPLINFMEGMELEKSSEIWSKPVELMAWECMPTLSSTIWLAVATMFGKVTEMETEEVVLTGVLKPQLEVRLSSLKISCTNNQTTHI